MQLKPFLVAATAGALVLAPACGSDRADDREADRVIAVIEGWHRDLLAGDGDAACARMTERGRRSVVELVRLLDASPSSCADAVRHLDTLLRGDNRRMIVEMRFGRVRIDGDRAEIRDEDVALPQDLEYRRADGAPATFVRTHDGWKMDQVG